MDPVAFHIGSWPIRWYAILITAGLLIGIFLFMRLIRKRGLPEDPLWTTLLIVIPCAVIGARLYYVAFSWDYYSLHPELVLSIWRGGLAIHGAIIVGVLIFFLCCRHYKLNSWSVLDCAVIPLSLGQAIGRWGNFVNQEAHGFATDVPWAIQIDGVGYHPTFLYESVWDLLLFVLLLSLFKKQKRSGTLFLLYLVLYSVGRFCVEWFRTDSLMIGPLRQAQVLSLVLIALGGALLWYRARHTKPDLLIETTPKKDGGNKKQGKKAKK